MNTIKMNVERFAKYKKEEKEFIIDFGIRMMDIVANYAISDDELESISKDVAQYVTETRITNLKPLLFNYDKTIGDYRPRRILRTQEDIKII